MIIGLPYFGCDNRSSVRGDFLHTVFADFEYAGELIVSAAYPQTIAQPGSRPPKKFYANRLYVFQPKGNLETVHFVTEVLPDRLSRAGVKVMSGPRNEGDFAIPDLGGPIWTLQFSQMHYRGRIYNRYNPMLAERRWRMPSGSSDDFVVVFEN